jgi:putative membrane protein
MLILKGFIIGVGKIIPGVSGSMLAISMGIYQQLIDSIINFFNDIKNNSKFLLKIGIGVLMAIMFFSNVILECLEKYYIITMFFFIGLIIGSFKDIRKEIKIKNNKIILITIVITLLIGFININNEINISNTFLNFFYYIFVGLVDAFTMVVPGISGTATLMMIGAYDKLMNMFSNVLNLKYIIDNFLIILPYCIGMSVGLLLTIKLINYLFKNYKNITYNIIVGFSISTIVIMFMKCLNTNYNFINLIIAFLMLILGLYLSKKINHCISND